MAFFNVRQWIDRVSQFPNRRTLTNVEDPTDVKTYDLDRAEGDVSVRGTAITGANLTDLENRIGAAFTAVENAMPEANPAQEATGSLTKLKVGGTVYEVEGGGGGTTIEKITKAQWDAMTAEEREAFIGVVEDTNADYVPLTADNIPYDSENSIAEKVETIPTYASQMPLSPTDDTDTASAIGDLSGLDTTEKSSLVGAVNEVNTGLTNATTKTSGTITTTSGYTVRMQNLVKINGVVYGNFAINTTGTITSRTTIGKIPEGFRPYLNTSFLSPASSAVNYYQDRATNVIITTSGDIIIGDIVVPSGQNIKEISLTFAYNQGN